MLWLQYVPKKLGQGHVYFCVNSSFLLTTFNNHLGTEDSNYWSVVGISCLMYSWSCISECRELPHFSDFGSKGLAHCGIISDCLIAKYDCGPIRPHMLSPIQVTVTSPGCPLAPSLSSLRLRSQTSSPAPCLPPFSASATALMEEPVCLTASLKTT